MIKARELDWRNMQTMGMMEAQTEFLLGDLKKTNNSREKGTVKMNLGKM
jgi:hypothetical protein